MTRAMLRAAWVWRLLELSWAEHPSHAENVPKFVCELVTFPSLNGPLIA